MKKSIRYILALTLVLACMLCVVACGEKEPTLDSITAKIDGDYKVYLLDDLDSTKITVTVRYSDGKEEAVSSSDLKLSDFDTSVAGEQTLTITYGGKTTTLTINVLNTNKQKVEGIEPTFIRDGKSAYWKVRESKTGKWRYFLDEPLHNEVTEEELIVPKYVAKSAVITKEPTATDKGAVTITTTTDKALKVYIPNLDKENVDAWGYVRVSRATWTEDGVYAYRLNVDDLKNDWWGDYNYKCESDEYKIDGQVDIVRPYLESLEVTTDTAAPATSTKFVIDKVGTTKLDGEYTSRVVVSGKLLYGELDASMSSNDLVIYFKGEDKPFTERFRFKSLDIVDAATGEYRIVTNYFTASNDMPLGLEGIHCSWDKNGTLNDLLVKPGDQVVSAHKNTFNMEMTALGDGEAIAIGDVLRIDDFPCEIVKIKDITNAKELDQLTSIDSLIRVEVRILNELDIDMRMTDYQRIRTGHVVDIYAYEEGGIDFVDRKVGSGKVTSIISKIKADIEVSDAHEINVGDTIEGLMPGELNIAKVAHLYEAHDIGNGKVVSVPNAKNADNVYKDVIIEIETTSEDLSLPESSNNYFSMQCLDYLNGCLSVGETIKVYSEDKSIVLTMTITAYNFD